MGNQAFQLIGQDQCREGFAHPIDHDGLQEPRVVVFYQPAQPPVANGPDDHVTKRTVMPFTTQPLPGDSSSPATGRRGRPARRPGASSCSILGTGNWASTRHRTTRGSFVPGRLPKPAPEPPAVWTSSWLTSAAPARSPGLCRPSSIQAPRWMCDGVRRMVPSKQRWNDPEARSGRSLLRAGGTALPPPVPARSPAAAGARSGSPPSSVRRGSG